MELTGEVGSQDGGEQLKLDTSDFSFPKSESESPASLNPSITFGKSSNSFGMFYPRSKGVSRTER